MRSRVAALFCDPLGVYSNDDRFDVWGPDRDAREYPGPLPVIAHPPCARWGWHARAISRDRIGDDGGCFEAAFKAVQLWGGVLEHPAGSAAFYRFNLPLPTGVGWTRGLVTSGGVEWSCSVEQGWFGHPAPKLTWLYLVTRSYEARPPPLLPVGRSSAAGLVSNLRRRVDREATPTGFRDLLYRLVVGAHPPGRVTTFERIDGASGRARDTARSCHACLACHKIVTTPARGPVPAYCSPRCRKRGERSRGRPGRGAITRDLLERVTSRDTSSRHRPS